MSLPREHKPPKRATRTKKEILAELEAKALEAPEPKVADGTSSMGKFLVPFLAPIEPPARPSPPQKVADRAKGLEGDYSGHRLAPFMFEVLDIRVDRSWPTVQVHFRTRNRDTGNPLDLWFNHECNPGALISSESVEREVQRACVRAMRHELAESFLRADGSYVEDPHPEERWTGRREVPDPALLQNIQFEFEIGAIGFDEPCDESRSG